MNAEMKLPDGLQLAVNALVWHSVGCDGYKVEIDAIRAEHAKRLTLQHHAADQAQRVAGLGRELETERMRLAACGVIAISDTPESAAKARQMLPEYESASASDVARRVDECMSLRQRVADLEAERATTAAHIASIARQLGDKLLQVDDIAVRVLAVAVERDELRARLADIEGRDSSPPTEEAVRAQFRAYDGSGWAATATPWQIWRDAVKWALYARPVPAIPADPGMLTVSMAPSSAYAMGWNDCRAKMLAAAPEAAR